jgi:hypothetical protein
MIEDHLVLIPAGNAVKLEHVREIRLDLIPGAVTTNNDVFGHHDNPITSERTLYPKLVIPRRVIQMMAS